ncbi:MAG TPA: orotidine-5'-phosphate decarboxylase [Thermoanaerobaculales bacterium]|nr:orotidine-5'-phosphate decarboxylase [Thermoanaerobaculales bacterium]HPA82125.1 orotidine-5'-phosphate decarboxylase [Thermoanaerobaculales bacterium]HQL28620.1 orotidine-5'-phosphate decarboxylase [Thermoanaerobaculales bacterium]HQN96879.1 orotidine-5'-phosphate decarboxylase [Thermoanaerobaculales bacterium]HQP43482.1 orotidine-5'-phosphate decarboxylase [Thermoanaerobaculales bacterium]
MTRRQPRLCIALDGSDRRWILDTARALAGTAGWLKVGLEAFVAHGPRLVGEVAELGPPVFLDLKLHDIPATVRRAAANAAACGARMLTVHSSGGRDMMEAAVEGAGQGGGAAAPLVVAVTLLTSLDEATLEQLSLPGPPEATVLRWAELARESGVAGVVASAREAAAVRARCGRELLIVTPGVRPAGDRQDDQRRTATPAEAVRAGADILVVGRPITGAASPLDAARRIIEEMAGAASE